MALAAELREKQSVFIDALPYIDQEYSSIEGIRGEVEKLIKEELSQFRPKKDYLAALPADSLLEGDFERMKKKLDMEKLDVQRYQLQQPKTGANLDAWKEAMKNGQSQVQHQAVRMENLDLMSEHGPMAWRMYNTMLEANHASMKAKLEDTKQQIEAVNKKRKLEQTNAGRNVRQLEMEWEEISKKNLSIDAVVQKMQSDITQLRPPEAAGEPTEDTAEATEEA